MGELMGWTIAVIIIGIVKSVFGAKEQARNDEKYSQDRNY